MAMACFWEICEYVLSLVVHNDPQMVAATGIQDTMLDMIVCTIGALLMLIPYYFYYKKKEGRLHDGRISANGPDQPSE